MRALSWSALAGLALAACLSPALAQSPALAPDIHAELLVGQHDSGDLGTAWMGVKVELGEGWKTYWVSPGDSGLPSEFDWSSSMNLAGAETLWPAPQRIEVQGVETIGYKHEVVFPIKVRVTEPTKPASVSLKLALYACSTICVRQDLALAGEIPPAGTSSRQQSEIDRWRARVPSETGSLAIRGVSVTAGPSPKLSVHVRSDAPLAQPDVFVRADPPVFAARPVVVRHDDGSATLTAALDAEDVRSLDRESLIVTVVDGDRSGVGYAGAAAPAGGSTPENASVSQAQSGAAPSLWAMLGVGLLGGLVLNLMPCVFPVLSLKLLAFASHPGRPGRVRASFAASAAGMVASFLALASTMVAIKAAGGAVGWGVQFQQPAFLAIMALVVAGFAASLLGLVEITPPAWLMSRADRVGRGDSLAAHFGSGLVATLLATPCSAPFVGTAVGFALSRGPVEIFLVFLALGLGMAAPYLLIAAVPQFASRLPRPGRWMAAVKIVMGAALVGTALWLLVVLATVSGPWLAAVLAALIGLAFFGLALQRGARRLAVGLALGAAVAPIGVLAAAHAMGSADGADQEIAWRPFDPSAVAPLVAQGKTVFVDVTAAWCVTCKVNKAAVIDRPEVASRLSQVVPVLADWTKPDPRIAAYLRSFGRYGIPFNVVYGPGAPAGLVLPELLTKAAVLDALATASRCPVPAKQQVSENPTC